MNSEGEPEACGFQSPGDAWTNSAAEYTGMGQSGWGTLPRHVDMYFGWANSPYVVYDDIPYPIIPENSGAVDCNSGYEGCMGYVYCLCGYIEWEQQQEEPNPNPQDQQSPQWEMITFCDVNDEYNTGIRCDYNCSNISNVCHQYCENLSTNEGLYDSGQRVSCNGWCSGNLSGHYPTTNQ
tara:strand:+ start:2433 stop:2972 length:540 start_codon:yes stop_codon:yes gene_type:complete